MNMIIYLEVMLALMMIMTVLMIFLEMKMMKTKESSTSFESGFLPMTSSKIPFSNQFFMIAILFLVFDMELIILMPSMMIPSSLTFSFLMFIIAMFLTLSLIMEWAGGLVLWVKS